MIHRKQRTRFVAIKAHLWKKLTQSRLGRLALKGGGGWIDCERVVGILLTRVLFWGEKFRMRIFNGVRFRA